MSDFALLDGHVRWDPNHLRRPNPYRGLRRLLVYCSGAEPNILAQNQTEQATYMSLGGTVLATGVLAATSSTFALSMAFRVPFLAVLPIGLVWGLIILNLDRWLVASFRRLDSLWWTTVSIVPRIVLAGLFGFIIAEPMLLRIFENEIDEKIEALDISTRDEALDLVEQGETAQRIAAVQAEFEQLNATPVEFSDPDLTRLDDERDGLREEIRTLQAAIDSAVSEAETARTAYVEEVVAGCADGGGSCNPGEGPFARAKLTEAEAKEATAARITSTNEERIATLEAQLAQIDSDRQAVLDSNRTQIDAASTRRDERLEDLQTEIENLEVQLASEQEGARDVAFGSGLLARSDALGVLRQESNTVRWLYYLLASLFVAIDIIPILGKYIYTLGPPKPYERMREAIELDVAAEAEKAEISRSVELRTLTGVENYRAAAMAANQQRILNYAAAIQRQLAEASLARWEYQHAPDDFIYSPVDPSDVAPVASGPIVVPPAESPRQATAAPPANGSAPADDGDATPNGADKASQRNFSDIYARLRARRSANDGSVGDDLDDDQPPGPRQRRPGTGTFDQQVGDGAVLDIDEIDAQHAAESARSTNRGGGREGTGAYEG